MPFTTYDVPTAADLQATMDKLSAAIGTLNELILESELLDARVFEVPLTQAGEEGMPCLFMSSDMVEGEDALKLTTLAYSRFYAASAQSTRSVYRLPGVLCLKHRNPGQVMDQVSLVNQLKTDFLCLVRLLPDRNTRFEVVHRLFPMAITLQITRQIQCYDTPMRSVNFTWGRKTALRVVTRDEVIEMLEQMRLQCPVTIDPDTWDDIIDRDVARISSLPADTPLRYRRELKVRPLCNLLLDDGTKRLREGNLPILLLVDDKAPRIGMLHSFDANQPPVRGRKPDGDHRQTESERVLDHLLIYRVRPS